MTQLEFQQMLASLPPAEARPKRCRLKLLAFMADLVRRKARRGLSDLDVLVLLALVPVPQGERFQRLVDAIGRSQTGVWNSLERLEDYGFVVVKGPPGKHTYALTNAGVVELKTLAGK
jgi:hypothetical protein